MYKIEIDGTGIEFECEEGDSILRAALRASIGVPYSCNVGSCANCKFTLIEGQVSHNRADAPAWGPRDEARGRWLACQSVPRSDCRIKYPPDDSYSPHSPPKVREALLTETVPITRDIMEFRFRTSEPTDFLPGQYALLHVENVDGGRPYSMCNLPGGGSWNFQIKRVPSGEMTGRLFEMPLGTPIKIDGPYSTAYLREDRDRPMILAAGGSGLSPMVSIARGALDAGLLGERDLHFYYGCRGLQDLFDPAVVLGELGTHVRFNAILSEDTATGWRQGFLHDAIAEDFGDDLSGFEVYFAGPVAMAAAMQAMLHKVQVPRNQMHFDEFY